MCLCIHRNIAIRLRFIFLFALLSFFILNFHLALISLCVTKKLNKFQLHYGSFCPIAFVLEHRQWTYSCISLCRFVISTGLNAALLLFVIDACPVYVCVIVRTVDCVYFLYKIRNAHTVTVRHIIV